MATRKPITTTITIPALKKGEVYAGILLKDGKLEGAHHLILLPGESKKLTHQGALDWAEGKKVSLPDRHEARLLWTNQSGAFKQEWYWTGEQYAGRESGAWGQLFGYGDQLYWFKDFEFRARAVRRVVI